MLPIWMRTIYKATVKKFNGINWEVVGLPGFSADQATYPSIAIDGSLTPYVVYADRNKGEKATVMKLNGSSWEVVGSAGFSAGMADNTSIAIDGSGTPYVVYRDGANGSKTTVMKFNGSSWEVVGTAGFSAGMADHPSIAIDGSGRPYVAYSDMFEEGAANVMDYDGESWDAVGSSNFSEGHASYTSIALNGSGTPYIVFNDEGYLRKAIVMLYNGAMWVNVGQAGFSAGSAYHTSIAIAPNGIPVVVYSDEANSGKATVMKFAESEDSSLPVELSEFTARAAGNTVNLWWRTESEVNNFGFEVERRPIAVSGQQSAINNWQKIGLVAGAGTSTAPTEYSFEDSKLAEGRYTYRLKQIDLDGSFEYSQIVEIEIIILHEFSLSQNYPNPFNSYTNITFSIATESFVSLYVFDASGRAVSDLIARKLPAGNYSRQWNPADLPSGIYFYRLQVGASIQTKKILLLK